MRVLFLTKYSVLRAGVAEPIMALCRALPPLGAEVVVYSSDSSARAGRMPSGHPCMHGPLPRPRLFGRRLALRHLADVCRQERIDLIHCHGLYRPGYAARLLKRATGIPYVVTSWGDLTPSSSRLQRRSVRRRCREILADADAVTHLTTQMERCASDLCDVSAKSASVPNGVDLSWWKQPPAPLAESYILALGRLDKQKGFHVVLAAYARMVRAGFDRALVIAGDGPAGEDLRDQARRLGLPMCQDVRALATASPGTVCFPGFVTGPDKRNLLAGCRVMAFSSQYGEGFPGVVLEAMAAGRALIASDIPAVHSIVTHGRNGLIVPPADEAAWAKALERLLRDGVLRGEMETNNRQDVRQYDWPVVAAQYKEVYDRVLGKR